MERNLRKVPLQSLKRLDQAVEEFRGLYPDAPILSFQVFLTVALEQGINASELNRRLGSSSSALSRHLKVLSAWRWNDKSPGLDLITILEDPNDARGRIAVLTPKGRLLACKLVRILEPWSEVTAADFDTPFD